MAKRGFSLGRFARIGNGGKKTFGIPNKLLLLGGGIVGAGALYYILAGKSTGFAPLDMVLEPVGDLTGLGGKGSSLVPQLFGGVVPAGAVPPATPVKPVGLAQDFSGGYMGQSYATYPTEGGIGIAQAYLGDAASGYEDWYSNTSSTDDRISIS
jgi:hypothetical protein